MLLDHVDILGNHKLLEDVLRIVTNSDKVDNQIISQIKEFSDNVVLD